MARLPQGWSALILCLSAIAATAQSPPESYRVVIRYRIDADREGRVLQFRELNGYLKSVGFVADARENAHLDAFDPTADRLEGTVPANKAGSLLGDPRVLTIAVEPSNAPKEKPAVVQISCGIRDGLPPEQQRQLHEQTVARLGQLGFRENVAYDHLGFTRIRGRLPGAVLPQLVKDVRSLPAGWFAPADSKEDLPLPIRGINPIRSVEWMPNAPDTLATLPADLAKGKFSADLVKALADAEGGDKPIRIEMLFDGPPSFRAREIADRVTLASPSAILEGIVGQSAVIRVGKAKDAPGLANLPEVKSLRTARAISETTASSTAAAQPIQGLKSLHERGWTGKTIRVAILATGFPDREKIGGSAALLDLSGELSRDLQPATADPRHPGTGTAAALAVRAAAPDAELLLVRIDPYAFHQLLTVASATTGITDSEALQIRLRELTDDSNVLEERRKVVMDEYAQAMRNISDDEKPTQRREAAKKAYDKLKADEATFQERWSRYRNIRNGLTALSATPVIVNTVVSQVGQPHDGLSALNAIISEDFSPKPARSAIKAVTQRKLPVWIQAAGTQGDSIWAGPFLDRDGNGVMEFSPAPIAGQWTSELNFLAPLKANASIRISAQWREPIDADTGVDDSQFPLTLRLVRQIDPTGKTARADEMIDIAQASGIPVRIHRTDSAAVFEQTLDVVIPTDGTYALRVEGKAVDTLRPGRLPKMQLSPRIMVTANDAATAAAGSVRFARPLANSVGVGIPGESTSVITVGMADGQAGAGPGITRLAKPDLLAPARVGGSPVGGSAVSAGYVGGTVACLAGAGYRPKNLPQVLGIAPGSDLQLTDVFLSAIGR